MAADTLTLARARELFHYDPETGLLVWRKSGREAKTLLNGRYKGLECAGRPYRVHRVAWLLMTGEWPKFDVDHIDGNTINNRWANLRDVTHSVNLQNQRAARKTHSGLLGVFKNKKRWMARISIGSGLLHLGTYDTPEQAHAVYVQAKRVHHPGNTL